jgi:hypothetical protein
MTAHLMKRKFRNFPSAELLRRIAAARAYQARTRKAPTVGTAGLGRMSV